MLVISAVSFSDAADVFGSPSAAVAFSAIVARRSKARHCSIRDKREASCRALGRGDELRSSPHTMGRLARGSKNMSDETSHRTVEATSQPWSG